MCRIRDGLAEAGSAEPVVVLCPALLGCIPFGWVWDGWKCSVSECESETAVWICCGQTNAVEMLREVFALKRWKIKRGGRERGRKRRIESVGSKMVARDLHRRGRRRKRGRWKQLRA